MTEPTHREQLILRAWRHLTGRNLEPAWRSILERNGDTEETLELAMLAAQHMPSNDDPVLPIWLQAIGDGFDSLDFEPFMILATWLHGRQRDDLATIAAELRAMIAFQGGQAAIEEAEAIPPAEMNWLLVQRLKELAPPTDLHLLPVYHRSIADGAVNSPELLAWLINRGFDVTKLN